MTQNGVVESETLVSSSASASQSAWTDPSIDGPKLAFNNGQVTGVTEDMNPILPDIAGPVSADWHFTQWNPGSWFDPADAIVAPPLVDPVLGQVAYEWQAVGSSIAVFGSPGNYTYALTDSDGNLRDLNLESGITPSADFTFDKQVTFTADERVAAASNFGPVDGASAANCFTVAFNRQDAAYYNPNLPTISIFLQVELSVAGSAPKAYASFNTSGGNIYNVVPGAEGNQYLPGNPDSGGLHQVSINLSSAVAQMTQWLAEADPSVGGAVLDLSKWSLTGEYIGIEASTGSSLTLDVAHPTVSRDPNQPVTQISAQTVSITGGADAQTPVTVDVESVAATPSRSGVLAAGDTVSFTVSGSSALVEQGTTAFLSLSDGGKATFSGEDGHGGLTFIYTVGSGDLSSDLKVVGVNLNGSTIDDTSGASLDVATLASASGTDTGLSVDATAPVVSGDAVQVDTATGEVVVTGDAFALAHPGLLGSASAQYGTPGLNVLSPSGPNALVLPDNLGQVAVIDNAASSTVVVGDGNDLTYSGSSNALIIGGIGNDTVLSGAGNDTIALGGGHNQIYAGSGDSVIYSESADLVQAGSGHDTVSVTGSNATINGGYGSSTLAVDDSAGSGTTINVSTGATVTGSSGSVTTINAYGDTTVHGGAGGTAYNEQNGTLKFVGLGGPVTVTGGPAAGNDTLYGASGSNIVLASQAHNNVFVGNDPNYGAGGNVTLNGGMADGGNQFWAGSGNASLIGGTGGDTMVGGMGSATMVGGIGSATNYFDLFKAGSGSSTDVTIENFGAVAANKLTFFEFGQAATSAALRDATQTSNGTTLHLDNGATITLEGISKSQLASINVGYTDPS